MNAPIKAWVVNDDRGETGFAITADGLTVEQNGATVRLTGPDFRVIGEMIHAAKVEAEEGLTFKHLVEIMKGST